MFSVSVACYHDHPPGERAMLPCHLISPRLDWMYAYCRWGGSLYTQGHWRWGVTGIDNPWTISLDVLHSELSKPMEKIV